MPENAVSSPWPTDIAPAWTVAEPSPETVIRQWSAPGLTNGPPATSIGFENPIPRSMPRASDAALRAG